MTKRKTKPKRQYIGYAMIGGKKHNMYATEGSVFYTDKPSKKKKR